MPGSAQLLASWRNNPVGGELTHLVMFDSLWAVLAAEGRQPAEGGDSGAVAAWRGYKECARCAQMRPASSADCAVK